jgi:hypothetical protein
MKTEIFVHSAFSHLKDFIYQIPEHFSSMGEEVYNGRNDVRFVDVNGVFLAIKYFKRITLANSIFFPLYANQKPEGPMNMLN